MKILISNLLPFLPPAARAHVERFRTERRKRHVSIARRAHFYFNEDAQVTLINIDTGAEVTARVGGEWAGITNLRPSAQLDLPRGVVAIETGISGGHYYMDITEGIGDPPTFRLSTPDFLPLV